MTDVADGNVVIRKAGTPQGCAAPATDDARLRVCLAAPQAFLDLLGERLPAEVLPLARECLDADRLTLALAAGADMVWVGSPEGMPPEWWVGTYRPVDGPAEVAWTAEPPLVMPKAPFRATCARCAFLQPPEQYVYHNVNEILRADFIPVLEMRDAYGATVGYPGVLMNHGRPALTTRRFGGGRWLLFLFDEPETALSAGEWVGLLDAATACFASGLQVTRVSTAYASYRAGERVQTQVRVRNKRDRAQAVRLTFVRHAPDGAAKPLQEIWRCVEPQGEAEAVCDFLADGATGLHRVSVEVGCVPGASEVLTTREGAAPLFRHDAGYVQVAPGALETPDIVALDGANIVIDGEKRFWTGTHYYPSSSWWEWQWRDFRPALAEADFAAMRRCGYRIIRVWAEPEMDETSLRAMDAAIHLAARHGLVLDFTLFTQWVRDMAFERLSGEHVRFEFRHPDDFNVFGFSLRNLSLQREWTQVLGRRWASVGNLIYNLSNEVYVKNPDDSQMDAEARAWPAASAPEGPARDAALFAAWTQVVAGALREAGSDQPVIGAYLFSLLDGGDTWAANAHSDIMPWHNYAPPHYATHGGRYFEATCTGRPLVLEEFGCVGWNSTSHYEENLHWILGANISAALSYEWGTRWFAQEQSYMPLPMRDALARERDPRWFEPALGIAEVMPESGAGMAGYAPGFVFGSAYHGTPFPAESAASVGRFGLMGGWLAAGDEVEPVCVVVPDTGEGQAEAFMPIFEALWESHVPFSVWRASALDRLPAHIRFIICPLALAGAERQALERTAARGAICLNGPPEAWRDDARLPRYEVFSDRPVWLLTRPTQEGRLFVLAPRVDGEAGGDGPYAVTLDTGRHRVELGMASFALVLETAPGVVLVEGVGDVRIDGDEVGTVAGGPAFLMARSGPCAAGTRHCQVMMARPGTVTFPTAVKSVTVIDGATGRTVGNMAASRIDGRVLHVGQEDTAYVLSVDLGERDAT